MKRPILSLIFFTAFIFIAQAQQTFSIGTTQVKTNAVLYLEGNGSQGLIIPVTTNHLGITPALGMIVYNSTDGKIYKCNGSAWSALEGASPTLSVSGNSISISGGNSIALANTPPAQPGQLLMWDGSRWTPSPATGPNATGQVLKWNNGTKIWEAGTVTDASFTAGTGISITGSVISNTGDANAGDDITTASAAGGDMSGSFPNPVVANNAISSAKIADGTITAADLNAMGASANQVLKYNGTAWAPAADQSTPALNSTQILVGNASNVGAAVSMSGDATISNTGVVTVSNNAITSAKLQSDAAVDANRAVTANHIKDGIITSAKISDGTIAAADLNAMGASANQVLKYNGTAWAPAADQSTPTLNSTQILVGNASNVGAAVSMSGDATISNTGVVTVSNNAITSAKLQSDASVDANRAVTANHIKDGIITSAKISDGTIVDADINASAAIAGTKISPDFGAQNITTTGSTVLNTVSYTWPGAQGGASTTLQNDGAGNLSWASGTGWATTGNTGTSSATNFVGTTDAQDLVFKTNNAEAVRISALGSVGIGIVTPSEKLEVAGGNIKVDGEYTYTAAKTRNLMLHHAAFTLAGTNTSVFATRSLISDNPSVLRTSGGTSGNAAYFIAQVSLPDGAVVTELVGNVADNDATNDLTVRLVRQNALGPANTTMASITTTSQPVQITLNTTTITNPVIDNVNFSYCVVFKTTEANSALGLYSVRIAYTVTNAD